MLVSHVGGIESQSSPMYSHTEGEGESLKKAGAAASAPLLSARRVGSVEGVFPLNLQPSNLTCAVPFLAEASMMAAPWLFCERVLPEKMHCTSETRASSLA